MDPEDQIENIEEDSNVEENNVEGTPSTEDEDAASLATHSDYKMPAGQDAVAKYHLSGMYQNWFLDYASYVILERAVPHLNDGLKPVQRRILHTMRRLEDGRYNKVANIVCDTMKFHPHGDASIGDALVQLGQKTSSSTVRQLGKHPHRRRALHPIHRSPPL